MRLVYLVEDLQQLVRADAAKAFPNRQKLSLPEVIDQMLALYRPNWEAKGIGVESRYDPASERVTADRDELLQAIRNLVENAWKYTPEGGRGAISSQRLPEGVRTVIETSGEGIAEQDLPFIFERFYPADRSRSRAPASPGGRYRSGHGQGADRSPWRAGRRGKFRRHDPGSGLPCQPDQAGPSDLYRIFNIPLFPL